MFYIGRVKCSEFPFVARAICPFVIPYLADAQVRDVDGQPDGRTKQLDAWQLPYPPQDDLQPQQVHVRLCPQGRETLTVVCRCSLLLLPPSLLIRLALISVYLFTLYNVYVVHRSIF